MLASIAQSCRTTRWCAHIFSQLLVSVLGLPLVVIWPWEMLLCRLRFQSYFSLAAPNPTPQDVFDFSTNRWSRSVSSAFIRRSDHCGMWANNKLYIVGGYDPTYAILNTTEVYDPVARTVTVVPSMALPEPRGDVGCNAVGSVLFVHGGYYDPSGAAARRGGPDARAASL